MGFLIIERSLGHDSGGDDDVDFSLLRTGRGRVDEGGGGGEYARKDLSANGLKTELDDGLDDRTEIVEYREWDSPQE